MSNRVKFTEQGHSYTNHWGERYTSVTTVIGEYKNKFDPYKVKANGDTIVGGYVKKHGFTEEYWLAKWNWKKDNACARGTKFHKTQEDATNASSHVITNGKAKRVININAFTEPNIDFSTLPDGRYSELLLWSHYYKTAGTADIIDLDGEYFDVDDYKTNDKIDIESFKDWKTGHKMMLEPLSRLMDCNYIHYCIQLSTYAYFLEQLSGKRCRSICFHHHPPTTDNTPQTEGIKYTVPYLKQDVINMLCHYTGKPEQIKL